MGREVGNVESPRVRGHRRGQRDSVLVHKCLHSIAKISADNFEGAQRVPKREFERMCHGAAGCINETY